MPSRGRSPASALTRIVEHPHLDARAVCTVEQLASENPAASTLPSPCTSWSTSKSRPFLSAVRRGTVEGGAFFGVTPNLLDYFGLTARLASSLRIEAAVLQRRAATSSSSTTTSPGRYRLNSV